MWNVFGRHMTPYAVSIWIACLAALTVFLWQGRAKKLKPAALALCAVCGALLGLLGARAYYVLARWELFADMGFESFFAVEDEEYRVWGAANGAGFWGAVGGVCLAALISGKITGEKVSRLLDALAPAAALGIGISRFGEYSIGEGIGPEVDLPGLQFFPLAVMNEWEEWNYALFLLEGLVGVVLFLLVLRLGRNRRDGDRARIFLLLYSACQIVLEALRRDNFLRWLFVRVSQVTAAVVLLGLVIFGLARWLRKRKDCGPARLAGGILLDTCLVLLAVMAVALLNHLIFVREPMEMTSTLWWELICECPIPMLVLLAAFIALTALSGRKRPADRKAVSLQGAMLLVGAVMIIALEFGIDKSATLSLGTGYLMETVCSALMGMSAWLVALRN